MKHKTEEILFNIFRKPLRWTIFNLPIDYSERWNRWMNLRLRFDGAKDAVGGKWEELGQLQLNFLIAEEGIPMDARFLDVGCGSLRLGHKLIPLLYKRRYIGIDINEHILEIAREEFKDILMENQAYLFKNLGLNMRHIFPDVRFDIVWAHSLITHLPSEDVKTFLSSVNYILKPNGRFYFTYFPEGSRDTPKEFCYSRQELEFWIPSNLDVEFLEEEAYPHPRGQRMVKVRKEGEK